MNVFNRQFFRGQVPGKFVKLVLLALGIGIAMAIILLGFIQEGMANLLNMIPVL